MLYFNMLTCNTYCPIQSETCEYLYKRVMLLQGNNRPLCIKDPIGDIIAEGNTSLLQCLYDGAMLTAEYQQKWSLCVLHQGRSQSLTIEMSPVWQYIIDLSHFEYIYRILL